MRCDFKKYKEKFSGAEARFLGVDYGESRIGLAVSDVGRNLASPLVQLEGASYVKLMPDIARIVEDRGVGLVVVGLPLEMDGTEGAMASKARGFAAALAPYLPDVDIAFMDERLTSAEAEKSLVRDFDMSRAKRGKILDKLAAARILQRFLDSMNNS